MSRNFKLLQHLSMFATDTNFTQQHANYSIRARGLIHKVLISALKNGQRVHCPRFMCSELGLDHYSNMINLYDIDESFKPIIDVGHLRKSDIVIIVNYFGLDCLLGSALEKELRRVGCYVLFDNSHSYFVHRRQLKNLADRYGSLCSYSKSTPVPYGAELIMGLEFSQIIDSRFKTNKFSNLILQFKSWIYFLRSQSNLIRYNYNKNFYNASFVPNTSLLQWEGSFLSAGA